MITFEAPHLSQGCVTSAGMGTDALGSLVLAGTVQLHVCLVLVVAVIFTRSQPRLEQ